MEPTEKRNFGHGTSYGYGSLGSRACSVGSSDSEQGRQEDCQNLMATSREQLTMDLGKSENSMFTQTKGCFVTRSKGFGLLVVTLLLAIGVGYLTHHFTATTTCGDRLPDAGGSGSETDESGGPIRPKITDVRLPSNVKPLYYKLDLVPRVEPEQNFTIKGKVLIRVQVLEPTSKITVHIKNITIHEETVSVREHVEESAAAAGADVKELRALRHEYDLDREFYNLTVDQQLEKGKTYEVHIEYSAVLGDDLAGFYRSSYKDRETNETRWVGVTQFQPTDARRAFPCFDEPALKAEFEISIARKVGMTSISNMNLLRQEPVDGMPGWVWDHYNKSVPMSTYLVAFVVSDFEKRESDPSLSNAKVAVWARKDAIAQTEYAQDIGPKILTFFEQYFNITFPLPKQDMIALPDFNAGAMENWGLITYRETAMLFDPKVSTDLSRQRVATVIAHELAHQWFGNLVTPSWWSDLWLNEGFASYVEYLGTNFAEPDFKVMEQFIVEEIQNVFALDALDSSHPISVDVHHPDEINEIFDRISYAKGASIIRMMNHFLTEATFKQGLTNYLNKWKYSSTVQNNLWESLTEQARLDNTLEVPMTVRDVMDTWTLQKGYPVIYVDRHYVGKHANFTQTKFQLIRNETSAAEYESYRWFVPISYASPTYNSGFNTTKPEFWISKGEKFNDHGIHAGKTEWLIVNVQQTGYYRVNYDLKNWGLITKQLLDDHKKIHTLNRAQLLDDSLNLARASLLPYDTAFNLTQYLKKEDEMVPWESFLNAFGYIAGMLSRTQSYGMFKGYMRALLQDQYSKVGFMENATDVYSTKFHRMNIVRWSCGSGNPDCIQEVKTLFGSWMKTATPDTENPIPNNMKSIVYCNAIRHGNEKEWDFLWDRYLGANVASEKIEILKGLACTQQTWLLHRFLNWAIDSTSGIRKQDAVRVISGVIYSDVGSYIAFNFIREKWPKIVKYLPPGLFAAGGILTSISHKLSTPFELSELKAFKTRYANLLGSAGRSLEQAIERVEANIKWQSENYATVEQWLKNTEYVSSPAS